VLTDFGSTDYAYGIALQPNGNIVAASFSNSNFDVARYLPR
jgi:hypothetical protein